MNMAIFERDWSHADARQQLEWLSDALDISLSDRIKNVMAGLTSFHLSVRNKAKYVLGKLQEDIKYELESGDKKRGLLASALLSAHVYKSIHENMPSADIKLYLQILLESGGRGPFYAWKLCQNKMFTMQTFMGIFNSLDEQCRLTLVNQYLALPPSIRREYAEPFVKILRDIREQKVVLKFYATLFDMEIPADIFLENINPSLRDTEAIIENYLSTEDYSDNEKADSLKALAMLLPVIHPSKLLKIINNYKFPKFRRIAFKVIERSPQGSYFLLADTIIDMVCRSSKSLTEAMDMFKAAVISCNTNVAYYSNRAVDKNIISDRRSILHEVIQRVNREIPELTPLILDEIASFSRFSFRFIQDMAEDPTGTLFQNSDIERALICGMIRKRPERVLKIFETYINHPEPNIKNALTKLIEKINNSLAEEKNELKRQFDQLISATTPVKVKKEKGSFFKSLFTTTLDKKIARLKDASSYNWVDLREELIEDVDLSSSVFLSSGIFTGSIIKDVDFSFSSFQNCSFNKTFFYNVKMSGTSFTNTSFEEAVFIDVIGVDTQFNGCNFTGAYFLNSRFDSSYMVEAIFAGSTIVKTSFSKTNLSGATFVCSQISMVTFSDTKLEKTDFSGATGKFCRFSLHTLSRAETEQAELFSRIIELSPKDISGDLITISQDKTLMNEIRMLIFTELIQRGKDMFLLKNRYSILSAFDLFQPDQADLFELIPLLIHENIDLYTPSARSASLAKLIELDGVVRLDGKPAGIQNFDIPHGIAGYLPNSETQRICKKYFDKKYLYKDGMVFIERPFCYIEALFTMGSIGSIAHTSGSDIDYWVCIREYIFDNDKLTIFRKKLDTIEKWAKDEFRTEIHFFIVDIEKAKISDFGGSDSESSGSAQGRLLKEEFYRTMIHLAGKLPFWSTLPVDVSKNYYYDLFIRVCPHPKSGRFIDFGDIHDIPTGEYFGASVWQMFKYLKSPFKSVLKMGLLEKYIYEKKRERTLLCNQFKREWMNPGLAFNFSKSDPYYLLLNSLVAYYKKIDEKHPFAKIVLSSFFSKLGITDEKELKKSAFGLKEILIKHCMDEWGWTKEDIFDVGDFKNWSYDKISSESVKIRQFMVQTYKQCRRIWTSSDVFYEKESLLTPRDRTILGRKMVVQFSMDEKAKVETLLLVSKSGLSSGLSLAYNDDVKIAQRWLLMHKWQAKDGYVEKNEMLKRASSIEELGAWLIHNQLYVKNNHIKLVQNPTVIKSHDVRLLFHSIYDFFADDIKRDITNDELCSKSKINLMFISINFAVPRDGKVITEWSVIYRNSWGEMFFYLFKDNIGSKREDDVKNRVKNALQLSQLPENLKILSFIN